MNEVLSCVFQEDATFFLKLIQKFKEKTITSNDSSFVEEIYNLINNHFFILGQVDARNIILMKNQDEKKSFLFENGIKEEYVFKKLIFQLLPSYYTTYYPLLSLYFQALANNWIIDF